jgi:DNA-binding response OmpR family regulator
MELAQRLRAHSLLNPVILITSRPSETLRRRACAAGIPIVEKPLLGNTLVDDTVRSGTRNRAVTPPRASCGSRPLTIARIGLV